jgi:hypothetical protein
MGTTAPEVVSRVCTPPCVDAEVDEEEGGTATTESLILPPIVRCATLIIFDLNQLFLLPVFGNTKKFNCYSAGTTQTAGTQGKLWHLWYLGVGWVLAVHHLL